LLTGRFWTTDAGRPPPAAQRLLGVTLQPLPLAPDQKYYVASLGQTPLTDGVPAGSHVLMKTTGQVWAPQAGGAWLPAAEFTDASYRPVIGATPLAAAAYGQHRGSRWAYFGFEKERIEEDERARLAAMLRATLVWLGGASAAPPAIRLADWPPGFRSAQLVEMDTELDDRKDVRFLDHALALGDMMAAVGARASFYCVTGDLARAPQVLERLAAQGHELGFHGERHDPFDKLPEALQAARIAAMLAEWQRLRPGARGGGFRPPYEAYDVSTERALEAAGIEYHVADPNASRARLPHFADLGEGRRLLRLPRTQPDDYNFTLEQRDAATTRRLLRIDADAAERIGALALLSVHPQFFGPGMPVREAMPDLLAHVRRPGSGIWLAAGTDIAAWWRSRERVRLVPQPDGLRIEVADGPPMAGISIIVDADLRRRHIRQVGGSSARLETLRAWPAHDGPVWQTELRLFDLPAGATELHWASP
jgi:peptidoglycan/xylan/chitin deacetylase (PgdA/CDA1 family)